MEPKGITSDSAGALDETVVPPHSLPGPVTPLSAVLEAALDAIVTLDDHGKVVHMNLAAEQLFGHTRADALGLDISELVVSPVSSGAGEPEFQRYFTKSRGPVLAQRLEMLALHASGSTAPVELTLVRLATEEPLHYTAYIRDLSDQKRALAALRDSEERYRDLVENANDIIYTHDLAGRLTSWNRAGERITGYKADEILGKNIAMLVAPDHLERARRMIAQKVAEGGRTAYELELLTSAGGRLTVEISSRLARQPGKPPYVQGMAHDITARKRAEQALKEADRKKDEFLAMLAHELRNPLAPIRNALQILSMEKETSTVVREMHEMMERQVQQMVRLVDDLFDVSRITRGTLELRRERVDVLTVVATALETSRPFIQARKQQLTVELPNESIFVHADRARLAQVLANLLNNSARYTPEGGEVKLAVVKENGQVAITVRDNGIGIPAELLAHVFDMFTQVDKSHAGARGGLGIGLTLVRNLVEMHGGRVEAASGGAGQGCEFTVRLPLLEGPVAPGARSDLPPLAGSSPVRKHRVLVVDDNIDAAESLGHMLRLLGHEVNTVHDGPAALELAATCAPDVVLLDIGLPGMDGFEVARRLRKLAGLEQVLLIAQTGWGQKEDRQRSREAGIDHHLLKPLNLTTLQELLGALDGAR